MKSILYTLLLLGPFTAYTCCPPAETVVIAASVCTTHPVAEEVIEYVRTAMAESEVLSDDEKARFTELFDKALKSEDHFSFLPCDEMNELHTLVVNAGYHHVVRIGLHIMGCMAMNRMVLHHLPLDEYEAIKLAASCGEWGRMQQNGIVAAGIGYVSVAHPVPHHEWVIQVIQDKNIEVPEETGYPQWGFVMMYNRTPRDLWGFPIQYPIYEAIDFPAAPQEAS